MATARVPHPSADDPAITDPRHYKVEFEDDRVRVVGIKYGPGEKSVMHSHPESVAVFVFGGIEVSRTDARGLASLAETAGERHCIAVYSVAAFITQPFTCCSRLFNVPEGTATAHCDFFATSAPSGCSFWQFWTGHRCRLLAGRTYCWSFSL